ncbi:30S ribosomal protein S5 [uncultured Sphingomonas sp.]|uniref:30S ribosomal protein S5 n=1 Tax=uncultured Sphingomonas sp. TaxID=158754 RepID=UPI0035C9E690
MADTNDIQSQPGNPAAVEAPAGAAGANTGGPATNGPGGGYQGGGGGGRGRGGPGGGGGGGRGRGGPGGNRGGRDNNRARRDGGGPRDEGGEELIEKLVHINRVSKTVKGGKRFGFAALVIVGDGKGRVGFGHGKAREVPEAISKGTAAAKRAMIRVPLREGRTLHHDADGHFGAGRVTLRAAPQGTGIIAGGPMRAIFESLGVADVVTKSVGTSNPYNMIRATFEALGDQTNPKAVAQRRGKKIADLLGRGQGQSTETAEADAAALVE